MLVGITGVTEHMLLRTTEAILIVIITIIILAMGIITHTQELMATVLITAITGNDWLAQKRCFNYVGSMGNKIGSYR